MSDNDETVVEISVPESEVSARADAVLDWLLAIGVVVPNPSPGPAYLPGPEAAPRTTTETVIDLLWNTGVTVITDRMVFDSAQNVTPPDCPACTVRLGIDHYIDQMTPWLLSGEPTVGCPACGHAALLGDWPGTWTCQVGNLGVRFTNWPPLRDDFVGELGRRIGPRWRVVRAHR